MPGASTDAEPINSEYGIVERLLTHYGSPRDAEIMEPYPDDLNEESSSQ
jgi:hypothetical protein